MYKAIISTHTNTVQSGVAKFGKLLSDQLSLPYLSIKEYLDENTKGKVLVSIKIVDCINIENEILEALVNKLKGGIKFDIFFHSFHGFDIEHDLINISERVFCANREITHALDGIDKPIKSLWCPPLVDNIGLTSGNELTLFSFGMAHKIQTRYFKTLKTILDATKKNYSIYISTAFHEKAGLGDFQKVKDELKDCFSERIQFLGFLSDPAVNYFLKQTDIFIAFFDKGARDNNTSLLAAMSQGTAVLTNIDEFSPAWMEHNYTILDINTLKLSDMAPAKLKTIAANCKNETSKWADWKHFTNELTKNE